jgi:uncharacterized protein (DUF2267 family)
MSLNFQKYAQEGQSFVNNLAAELGHPEEVARTGNVLRAVLHTLRERITISESLHLLSQLPMFLKGIYVDNWKFREKPMDINTKEEFAAEVERHQQQHGEREYSWNKSTEEIIQIVFSSLGKYISDGEYDDIIAQMPKNIKEIFR